MGTANEWQGTGERGLAGKELWRLAQQLSLTFNVSYFRTGGSVRESDNGPDAARMREELNSDHQRTG